MARLSVTLLGPLEVTLDGGPITTFQSNKVRALLAYLAVEADRPHRRDALATLLWPNWPDRAARANLRRALSNLRKAIGDRAPSADRNAQPPFLHITRETIQFNSASDCWVDVVAFRALVGRDGVGERATEQLREALALERRLRVEVEGLIGLAEQADQGNPLRNRRMLVRVDVLIPGRAPGPFDERVVQGASTAVHARANAIRFQP